MVLKMYTNQSFDYCEQHRKLTEKYTKLLQHTHSQESKQLVKQLLDNIDNEINEQAKIHFDNIMVYITEKYYGHGKIIHFANDLAPGVLVFKQKWNVIGFIIEHYLKENIHKLSKFIHEINKMSLDFNYLCYNILELYHSINRYNCRKLYMYRVENGEEIHSLYVVDDNGDVKKWKQSYPIGTRENQNNFFDNL